MDEEEKKAIERIEDIIYKRDETNYGDDREITLYEDDIQKISKLLNLIEKQQKLIEECDSGEVITENQMRWVEDKYISKDKIREEIKELDNMQVDGEVFKTSVNFAKKELKELLEEE